MQVANERQFSRTFTGCATHETQELGREDRHVENR